MREVQPFERGTLSRIGDNLADLHLLARLDRHRAPHLQAAFLRPYYVESEAGADIEFRGDWRTWAETEYTPGTAFPTCVHFAVEVRFESSEARIDHIPVADTADAMVKAVRAVVDEFANRRPR